MRNGAPRACHVGFKLKMCFFPFIFCVILSPHYNPSVYPLISSGYLELWVNHKWIYHLYYLHVYNFIFFKSWVIGHLILKTTVRIIAILCFSPNIYLNYCRFPQAGNVPDGAVQPWQLGFAKAFLNLGGCHKNSPFLWGLGSFLLMD